MAEMRADLLEFLATEEAQYLTERQVMERFPGLSRNQVYGARRRLREQAGSANGSPAPPLAREEIPISGLELDAGTRVRSHSEETISRYAKAMELASTVAGFPPLEAWDVGLPRPVLVKGFGRLAASERIFGSGFAWPVVRKSGQLAAAVLEAMRDNREHGAPLSKADRTAILIRIFDDYGAKWTTERIVREVGEKDREFIDQVRAQWLRDRGQSEPETVQVERSGKTIEVKNQRRRRDDDRGPDAGESDAMDVDERGVDEGEADKIRRVDRQYLLAIPARAQVHPSAHPALDRLALAFKDASPILASLKRWCEGHFPDDGDTASPLYAALEKVATMPRPIPVGEDAKGWVACRKCAGPDGLSTGRDGDHTCRHCGGTGVRIPGF